MRDDLSEFYVSSGGYDGDLRELDVAAQQAAWEAATRPKLEKIQEEDW